MKTRLLPCHRRYELDNRVTASGFCVIMFRFLSFSSCCFTFVVGFVCLVLIFLFGEVLTGATLLLVEVPVPAVLTPKGFLVGGCPNRFLAGIRSCPFNSATCGAKGLEGPSL